MLERAWRAGLKQIVVTGSEARSNERALMLARAYPGRLYATAGLHPHHASRWSDALGVRIKEISQADEVVALGECGLDYFRDLAPRAFQRNAFASQLELASATGKPVFLHQRDAHADFNAILREYRASLVACVVHCFTDNAAALDDYLALDCYIGITGWICDERRGTSLRDLVRRIPINRLLIESDSPYLLPRNLYPAPKSRRNEPAFLYWVARGVAEALDESYSTIAERTAGNARRFFRIPSDETLVERKQADEKHGKDNQGDNHV